MLYRATVLSIIILTDTTATHMSSYSSAPAAQKTSNSINLIRLILVDAFSKHHQSFSNICAAAYYYTDGRDGAPRTSGKKHSSQIKSALELEQYGLYLLGMFC